MSILAAVKIFAFYSPILLRMSSQRGVDSPTEIGREDLCEVRDNDSGSAEGSWGATVREMRLAGHPSRLHVLHAEGGLGVSVPGRGH